IHGAGGAGEEQGHDHAALSAEPDAERAEERGEPGHEDEHLHVVHSLSLSLVPLRMCDRRAFAIRNDENANRPTSRRSRLIHVIRAHRAGDCPPVLTMRSRGFSHPCRVATPLLGSNLIGPPGKTVLGTVVHVAVMRATRRTDTLLPLWLTAPAAISSESRRSCWSTRLRCPTVVPRTTSRVSPY